MPNTLAQIDLRVSRLRATLLATDRRLNVGQPDGPHTAQVNVLVKHADRNAIQVLTTLTESARSTNNLKATIHMPDTDTFPESN